MENSNRFTKKRLNSIDKESPPKKFRCEFNLDSIKCEFEPILLNPSSASELIIISSTSCEENDVALFGDQSVRGSKSDELQDSAFESQSVSDLKYKENMNLNSNECIRSKKLRENFSNINFKEDLLFKLRKRKRESKVRLPSKNFVQARMIDSESDEENDQEDKNYLIKKKLNSFTKSTNLSKIPYSKENISKMEESVTIYSKNEKNKEIIERDEDMNEADEDDENEFIKKKKKKLKAPGLRLMTPKKSKFEDTKYENED